MATDVLTIAEEEFMAESIGKRTRTRERMGVATVEADGTQKVRPLSEEDSLIDPGHATVTHTRDSLVRMWKPSPAGWRVRWVPSGNVRINLKNGWKGHCPDCGTDCGDDPNDCPAHEPSPVAYCPKLGCNHRINLRNLALDTAAPVAADPNAVDLGYGTVDGTTMLKAAMDQHIITRHRREARLLLNLRPDARLEPNTF